MKKFLFGFVLFMVVFCNTVVAQSFKPQRSDTTRVSLLRFTLRYTSDYLFMGRSDSAKAPYVSPTVGYYHKSGLFVRGSLSYLTASDENRIDVYTLSAGYDYFGEKIALGTSISEYIFNDLSYVVQAEMNTYLNAYAGYDFNYFMLYADASLGFSDNSDFFLGAEVTRTFYLFRNKLQITPALIINAGTQQYYNQYYSLRSTQTGYRKGKGGSMQQPVSSGHTVESTKFQLLDYEADVQVSYKIKTIKIFVGATWTFPLNPATIVTPAGTYTEDVVNGFYWTTGLRVNLDLKR
jgi:hypothetical protein